MIRDDDRSDKEMPLVDALRTYAAGAKLRLHVPCHAGNELSVADPVGVSYAYDGTEIPGLDDLFDPTGPIETAQGLAAQAYGAIDAVFCTCGSSAALIAGILAVCEAGHVIVPRDCHPSIVNACIIGGMMPVFVSVEVDGLTGLSLGTCPDSLVKAIVATGPDTPLLLINPTYYGLSPVTRSWYFDRPVIADEAHGAHFPFVPDLPGSLSACGAWLVISGMHKTGGALTQASLIRIHTQEITCHDIRSSLRLVHTSSPSYLLMASIDKARFWLSSVGRQQLSNAYAIAVELTDKLQSVLGISCPGKALAVEGRIGGYDPFRIVVPIGEHDTRWVFNQLRQRYGIQLEFEDGRHLIAVMNLRPETSVADEFISALDTLLTEAPKADDDVGRAYNLLTVLLSVDTEVRCLPRDAYFSQHKKRIAWRDAVGQIAAETVALYPPGVCIVAPGQLISEVAVETAVGLLAIGRPLHSSLGTGSETVCVVGGRNG